METSILPTPTKLALDIRLGSKNDVNFILDSWSKTMSHTYPNQFALDFLSIYQKYLQILIPNSLTVVANLVDQPDEIVSYLVYGSFRNNQIIHYAYTKFDARRQGILNKLIEFSNPDGVPIVFTHPAKNENVMRALSEKYIYDPSILSLMRMS